MNVFRTIAVALLAGGLCGVTEQAQAARLTQGVDGMGRKFVAYLPSQIRPGNKLWLVVWVHGAGGGAAMPGWLTTWVDRAGDCVLLAPEFPIKDKRGPYQYLAADTDKQLLQLFERLQEKLPLHDKLFIAGHSGGAQYAHRFMLAYPDKVVGCAAHSAGTWATGEYYAGTSNPIDHWHPTIHKLAENDKAAKIPLLITCGARDVDKSFKIAPLGRLEWAKKFAHSAADAKFAVRAQWIPNTGHSLSPQAIGLTRAVFEAATRNPQAWKTAVPR